MKTIFKNIEIKFEVTEDCIDFYVNDLYAGDFSILDYDGYIEIIPNSIDLDQIGYGRQGVYSFVIDTILSGELNDAISNEIEFRGISFKSVLRTEAATSFWEKRGFELEYNEKEHQKGEQDEIEIKIV